MDDPVDKQQNSSKDICQDLPYKYFLRGLAEVLPDDVIGLRRTSDRYILPAYSKLADLCPPIAKQALDLSRHCIFLEEVLFGLLLLENNQSHLRDILGELQVFFFEVLVFIIFDGLPESLLLLLLILVIFVHFLRDEDVLDLEAVCELLVLLFQLSVSL